MKRNDRSSSRRGVARLVVGTIIAGLIVLSLSSFQFISRGSKSNVSTDSQAGKSSTPPPYSASPFLNVPRGVRYVGSQTCRECHAEQYATYERTAHSQALATVDPQREPAGSEFAHAASGRHYAIFTLDQQLWHSESVLDSDGNPIVRQEFPLRYLIGSGRHSRSYLVECDGFLVESPLTWYASQQAWKMSPGYDQAHHLSFQRPTDIRCLVCHVGNVDTVGGALHRITIHEQAIGCEQCHGPGDLHVQRWRMASAEARVRIANDPTIVHPGLLDRERQEAICSQCHLRGDATALVRGREITDFRPGLLLTDVRVDYRLRGGGTQMKVVGHVDQMRLSRCYQQSDSLTCTTCHDPHADTQPADKVAYYRDRCRACHSADTCGLTPAVRQARAPQDHCAACHMPQSPTDIPHIAFTHHRIGRHSEAREWPRADDEAVAATTPMALMPILDNAQLPEVDRMRCLGMAYVELSDRHAGEPEAAEYARRAADLLQRASDRGAHDGEVDATLARLRWRVDPDGASELAHAALHWPGLSPASRVNALFLVADGHMNRREINSAIDALEELVRLRRNAEDWLLLGLCHEQQRDFPAALRAWQMAAKIAPFRPDIRLHLAEAYAKLGQPDQAAAQQALAVALVER